MASSKKRKSEGPAGDPKRSSGKRSETERSEGAPAESASELPSRPDPEVPEKARRRRYTAEYKLRILQEADALRESGEIGALLRREGIYSSHLITWPLPFSYTVYRTWYDTGAESVRPEFPLGTGHALVGQCMEIRQSSNVRKWLRLLKKSEPSDFAQLSFL